MSTPNKSGRFRIRRGVREWAVRLLLMLLALTVGQFGVTLFLLPALGADPYTVYAQGLAQMAGVSVGTAHMVFNLLLMAGLLAATRGYVLPGTVVCSFFAGPFIDLYSWLLRESVTPASPPGFRFAAVVFGTLFIAFGYALLIKADGGVGAADLVPILVSDKFSVQYRWAKMGCDVILVVAGVCLGGVIGMGTVIAVLLVGPVAQFFFPAMDRLVGAAVRRR